MLPKPDRELSVKMYSHLQNLRPYKIPWHRLPGGGIWLYFILLLSIKINLQRQIVLSCIFQRHIVISGVLIQLSDLCHLLLCQCKIEDVEIILDILEPTNKSSSLETVSNTLFILRGKQGRFVEFNISY